MSFKVAIIGAGSVGFTKTLISDLLKVPEFADVEFALTDINPHNLDMIKQIIDEIVAVNKLPAKVTATTDRREAHHRRALHHELRPRRRARGLRHRHRHPAEIRRRPVRRRHDLRRRHPLRPAQHPGDPRLLQGHPRSRRARRAVPQLCQPDGDEHLGGDQYGGVNTVGLCHGVQHGAHQIAQVLGVDDGELDYVCSGINHQTWYIDIRAKGRKIEKDELIAAFERHPVYSKQEKVRIDVLKRFGVYSTESNGHLSEYLPWYRKRPDEIKRWIDMSDWIHGETGGYLRYSTERRNWFETDFPMFKERGRPSRSPSTSAPASTPATSSRRSKPAASIAAISTSATMASSPTCRTTPSSRAPALSIASASTWSRASTLPLGLRRHLLGLDLGAAHVGRGGDDRRHRHCSSSPCCTTRWSAPSAPPTKSGRWSTRWSSPRPQWLPQYADAIPAAKARLAKSTVKTRDWEGAARKPVRSVEELREMMGAHH